MSKREELKDYVKKMVDGLVVRMRDAAKEAVDVAFTGSPDELELAAAPAPKLLKGKARRVARAASNGAGNGAGSYDDVLEAIRANPGSGSSEIARHTGRNPKEMRAALIALDRTRAIKKHGNGRGTTYTAGR